VAVVIDVLRWSTVVATALENGADAIECVETPEEALDLAAKHRTAGVLLGGERGNDRLPGFDLGNSPREYGVDRVAGRTIVSTTTNGTSALIATEGSRETVVAAFVNLESVATRLIERHRAGEDIVLVAAGHAGAPSIEDGACAGAIAEAIGDEQAWTPAAAAAVEAWRALGRSVGRVWARSPHAASLIASGHAADLEVCAAISTLRVVPTRSGTRRVTAGPSGG
jgi:2-phosphosulfolactate phosphatase